MRYERRDVPQGDDLVGLKRWLNEEMKKLQVAVGPNEIMTLDVSYVVPDKPREGMIALADGTHWNPGAGAGFYGYRGGAWHLLG